MLLTNNDGKILDNGREIVLRGAHCHLFSPVAGERSLNRGNQPFFAESNGCPNNNRPESGLSISSWGNFQLYLDRLAAAECNLARVFLSNGVEFAPGNPSQVTTLHPFARSGGKWRIAAAIRDGNPAGWSQPYFDRLASFVRAADQRGIAVQLCFFSYHDFLSTNEPTFKYWPASFWNPDNADDPAWGRSNLVVLPPNTPANGPNYCRAFQRTSILGSGLLKVQKAILEKVLAAVTPSGNLILELMNEPRNGQAGGQQEMARWLNVTTGVIAEWLNANQPGSPRPLISANASYPENGKLPATPTQDPASDVDAWAGNPALSYYSELDLISYHGLTGLADVDSSCGGKAPQTNREAIAARLSATRPRHRNKAIILSTDAVRFGGLAFPQSGGLEAAKRDGHVRTGVGYDDTLPIAQQVAQYDLDNWAYRTFVNGRAFDYLARVHFQNHSTYEASFAAIWAAYVSAHAQRWQSPVTRVAGGANHQNFWWAHRHLTPTFGLVNQFHTENGAGSAPAASGESEIGWRYDLAALGGPTRLSLPYQLISVSEIENPQTTVVQHLRLTLSAVAANGQPGAVLAQAERPLQRGQQGIGRLELEANLVNGRTYVAIATTRIAIAYQNRTSEAYGETIVTLPGLIVS